MASSSSFLSIIRSPWKLQLYFLKRLPMAFLAGLKVPHISPAESKVTVSLSYLTKNPFRSLYFACQAMAAELSTGLLAMNAIEQSGKSVAVLVVGLQAQFTKKATGTITFACSDGEAMQRAVAKAIRDDEPQVVEAHSIGKNADGEIVAEFSVRWSFKARTSSN